MEEASLDELITVWRRIIVGENKSWVMFRQGTCVILSQPEPDLARQAVELLREWGPVHVGTPSADFDVLNLDDDLGWVVTCHHPDILNYMPPAAVSSGTPDMVIGLVGRQIRGEDAQELQVVHVEDRR